MDWCSCYAYTHSGDTMMMIVPVTGIQSIFWRTNKLSLKLYVISKLIPVDVKFPTLAQLRIYDQMRARALDMVSPPRRVACHVYSMLRARVTN